MSQSTVDNFLPRFSKRWGLAFLLLLHIIASYYYISKQDITFDEPQYIEYAKRWLHGNPERIEVLDDSKSPIVAICWLPRIVRQVINPSYHLNDYGRKDQEEGRYMMILFSLLTAVYVYKWCRDLYGHNGWQMPLVLLLFDPLYLAYSTLITTDIACAAFLTAILYHFRKFLINKQRKQFYATAVFTGLGIVTKQSLLFVVLLLPLLSIIRSLLTARFKKLLVARNIFNAIIFGVVVLIIINIAYYFHKTFIPLGNYSFQSHAFQLLQSRLSLLKALPVPLPEAYMQSVDMLTAHSEIGAGKPESTYNGIYLFGELRMTGSFWYYYLVLLWYKMPIGILLLFTASVSLFFRKFRIKKFASTYLFLIVPSLFFWIILSFFNHFQTGIRHILIVFPLLYIGLGKLFYEVAKANTRSKILVAAAVVYSFVSVAIYYPYIIPYTNEWITDKKTVFRKIMDSSIDYGQANHTIPGFIEKHPEYKPASSVPDTGHFAIVMANVINTYLRDKSQYNWYQKLEPKGIYRYVVLLYDIDQKDLVKAGLWKEKK